MRYIDVSEWKEFLVGDLFQIINSKPYHNKDIEITHDKGINYVTRSKFNNGIQCKAIKKSEYIINPPNTISFGAENADFFINRKNISQVTRCIF